MQYLVRIRIKEGNHELTPGTKLPISHFPKRRAKRLLELGAIIEAPDTEGGIKWAEMGAAKKNRHETKSAYL